MGDNEKTTGSGLCTESKVDVLKPEPVIKKV